MSTELYQENDVICYYSSGYDKIITDTIAWVRKGYYHTVMDHYLGDEEIVCRISENGVKIPNPLYFALTEQEDMALRRKRAMIKEWINLS